MKTVYPVFLSNEKDGILVTIPGFEINTFGKNMAEAISMARDAIGIAGVDMQDSNECLPTSLSFEEAKKIEGESFVSLIDVDFAEYRRELESRLVKKNCTIPYWLNEKAEAAGINCSEVLREGLQSRLQSQESR
jgi:predicted RNase H-like HicB family nuclease